MTNHTPSDIERTREMLQEWGLSDQDYVHCYPEVVRFAEWAAVKVAAALAAARQEERERIEALRALTPDGGNRE